MDGIAVDNARLGGDRAEYTNTNSLVLRIEYGQFSAIFSGDAEGLTEDSAIVNFAIPGKLYTTGLSGSHHGAWTKDSNNYPWAEATRPAMTLWSSGHSYNHPRCEALHAFQAYTASAPPHVVRCGTKNQYQEAFTTHRAEYVTKTSGTITITTNGTSPLTVQCAGAWPSRPD